MNSLEYWAKREEEALKHYIKQEAEYDKKINSIYQRQLDAVQSEINAFYGKYAAGENISLAEAKKRVSKLDIAAYERKAKRYVAEKNFSKQANEELRLYNATMKINRLEMLKANIGLEMIAGTDELNDYMQGVLQGRTMDELTRQAGILGKSIKNNSQLANSIVNASFKNATFSNRIWLHQSLLKAEIGKQIENGMIQGKNPRALAKDIKKAFNASTYNAERLMRTEMARVQTEAQRQSIIRNGFDMYTFITNSGCCDICRAIDGKHYKIDKMVIAHNAPPLHPHCRCSIAAYEDSDEYEAWLDYLDKGGSTAEWNDHGKAEWQSKQLTKSANSNIIKEKNILIGRSIGAAAKNYPVRLPNSKQHTKLAEGQNIKGKAFAGKGTDTEIKDKVRLEATYNIPADEWQKVSGKAYILLNGKRVKAEIHWYEANGAIYEMKVKRYLDES